MATPLQQAAQKTQSFFNKQAPSPPAPMSLARPPTSPAPLSVAPKFQGAVQQGQSATAFSVTGKSSRSGGSGNNVSQSSNNQSSYTQQVNDALARQAGTYGQISVPASQLAQAQNRAINQRKYYDEGGNKVQTTQKERTALQLHSYFEKGKGNYGRIGQRQAVGYYGSLGLLAPRVESVADRSEAQQIRDRVFYTPEERKVYKSPLLSGNNEREAKKGTVLGGNGLSSSFSGNGGRDTLQLQSKPNNLNFGRRNLFTSDASKVFSQKTSFKEFTSTTGGKVTLGVLALPLLVEGGALVFGARTVLRGTAARAVTSQIAKKSVTQVAGKEGVKGFLIGVVKTSPYSLGANIAFGQATKLFEQKTRTPEQQRIISTQDIMQRASDAEQQALSETGGVKRFFIKNVPVIPRIFGAVGQATTGKPSFQTRYTEQLRTAGLSQQEISAVKRKEKIFDVGSGLSVFGTGIYSEKIGQRFVTEKFKQLGGLSFLREQGRKAIGKAVFIPIAKAGIAEGAGIVAYQESLSKDFRKINPFNILVGGVLGGLSAGTLGSVIATRGFSRSARGLPAPIRFKEGAKELSVRSVEYASYGLDPYEKISDVSYDFLARGASRVRGTTLRRPTILTAGKDTFTFGTTTDTRKQTSVKVPTQTFPSIFTTSRTPTRTATQSRTGTRTPTRVPVTQNIFTGTSIPIRTKVPTQTFTPTNTRLVVDVPVVTPQTGLPLIPLELFRGQRRGNRSGSIFGSYTPNLRGLESGRIATRTTGRFTGAEVRGIPKNLLNLYKRVGIV